MGGNALVKSEEIRSKGYTVRGIQVMLDLMSEEYNSLRSQFVTLENESHLRFQIGASKVGQNLRSQIATSNRKGGRRYLRYAFTEQGMAVLSMVHFGASLKDLGRKWFAFSRFDKDAFRLLERLEGEIGE
jgi:hypothetical protein